MCASAACFPYLIWVEFQYSRLPTWRCRDLSTSVENEFILGTVLAEGRFRVRTCCASLSFLQVWFSSSSQRSFLRCSGPGFPVSCRVEGSELTTDSLQTPSPASTIPSEVCGWPPPSF